MVTRFWHRYRMIGLERLPPSPVLFVCNHSGCGACEVIGMIGAWWRHFGLTRSPRALMHDTFYLIPGIAHLERAVGALRANRENGLAVLEAGRDLVVFPGGDLDACRPLWQARRVIFGNRRGYARLALEAGVPVVPVATRGSHYTYLVTPLTPVVGWLVHKTGLTRARRFPVTFALIAVIVSAFACPWWVTALAVVCFVVPNPVRITTEVLEPIDVVAATAHIADPAARVEAVHALVHGALEGSLK